MARRGEALAIEFPAINRLIVRMEAALAVHMALPC